MPEQKRDPIIGYDVAAEYVKLSVQIQNLAHQKIDAHIHSLHDMNQVIKALQQVLNEFNHAKSTKDYDFTHNETFQEAKATLHTLNPELFTRVFGHGDDVWTSKEDIDAAIAACSSEKDIQMAEVNAISMRLTQHHDDLMKYLESALKALESQSNEIRNSIRHQTGG